MSNIKIVLKILLVVIAAVAVRIICSIIFGGDPISKIEPFGSLVKTFGIIPIVSVMFFISYLHLAVVFSLIHKYLIGNKYIIGLIYGCLFGLIWFFGMIEVAIIKNTSIYNEIIFGISEAIPIIILGFLMSLIFSEDIKRKINKLSIKFIQLISSISITYLIGRYIYYIFIGNETSYFQKPLQTFFWTLGNGLLISFLYIFFKNAIKNFNLFNKAILFGFLIFGIDWILFNLFVPVLFNVANFEIFRTFFLRAVIDIIFISIAVIIFDNKKIAENAA